MHPPSSDLPFNLPQKGDVEEYRKMGELSEDVPFTETSSTEVAKAAGLSKYGYAVIKNFKGEYGISL
jgi:hypothetical protein